MQSSILPNLQTYSSKTTLWMGELELWMDEQYITKIWNNLNIDVVVKLIRDKTTCASLGYAFVDFGFMPLAQRVLDTFNGENIPNTVYKFKLNWASGGGLIDTKEDRQPEYSVFLGDLSSDCTEQLLLTIFQNKYSSCKTANIMTDPHTGKARGYGFIRFSTMLDQHLALTEMDGFVICNRPIRVSLATPKNKSNGNKSDFPLLFSYNTTTTAAAAACSSIASTPDTNTFLTNKVITSSHSTQDKNSTVFVGGLSFLSGEEELKKHFSVFGEITYVKILPGKGCGFVQFVKRQSAEMAIYQMNGCLIDNSRIRLSWGKSNQQSSTAITTDITPQNTVTETHFQPFKTSSSTLLLTQPISPPKPPVMPTANPIGSPLHPFSQVKRPIPSFFENNDYNNDSFFTSNPLAGVSFSSAPYIGTGLNSRDDSKTTSFWSSGYHAFAL